MTKRIRFRDLSEPTQFLIIWNAIITLMLFFAIFMLNNVRYQEFNQLNNSVVHKICWNETITTDLKGVVLENRTIILTNTNNGDLQITLHPYESVIIKQKQICKAEDLNGT